MGVTPCTDSITIAFGCQFRVDRRESSLAVILIAFGKLMPEILRDFVQQVAPGFGKRAMGQSRKPFFCYRCGVYPEDDAWKRDKNPGGISMGEIAAITTRNAQQ